MVSENNTVNINKNNNLEIYSSTQFELKQKNEKNEIKQNKFNPNNLCFDNANQIIIKRDENDNANDRLLPKNIFDKKKLDINSLHQFELKCNTKKMEKENKYCIDTINTIELKPKGVNIIKNEEENNLEKDKIYNGDSNSKNYNNILKDKIFKIIVII